MMKRKYYGFAAVTIMILSVILTGFYYVRSAKILAGQRNIITFKPIEKISMPETGEMNKIMRLKTRLTKLAYPGTEESSPVNLELFGYRPLAQPGKQSGRRDDVARLSDPVRMDYRLTFAFAAGDKRYCLINGMFYSEGTSLPDGSKIVKVEPGRVLIVKNKRTMWIELSQDTIERKKDISVLSNHQEEEFNEG